MSDVRQDYETRAELYEEWCRELTALLKRLIRDRGVAYHAVHGRVKTLRSTEEKIQRTPGLYGGIEDLHDFAGVRIITYFEDEGEAIASLINAEFDVDSERSVDKKSRLDPDRFGYLSRHFVVRLDASRRRLREYSQFSECIAEIQVRSILQHAWAEIEHDLGYKSKFEVPSQFQRRFSRLAGLLELADDEFVRLRDELGVYRGGLQSLIEREGNQTELNRDSMIEVVLKSEVVKNVLSESERQGVATVDADFDLKVANRVAVFRELGITTVGDLNAALKAHEKQLLAFLQLDVLSRPNIAGVSRAWPLIALTYLIGASLGREKLKDILLLANWWEEKALDKKVEELLGYYDQANAV